MTISNVSFAEYDIGGQPCIVLNHMMRENVFNSLEITQMFLVSP